LKGIRKIYQLPISTKQLCPGITYDLTQKTEHVKGTAVFAVLLSGNLSSMTSRN